MVRHRGRGHRRRDWSGRFAGGSVCPRVSRRFGEGGVERSALPPAFGVAAMGSARPMPVTKGNRPSVLGTGVAGAVRPVREKRVAGAAVPSPHAARKIKRGNVVSAPPSAGVRAGAGVPGNVPLTFPFHPDPVGAGPARRGAGGPRGGGLAGGLLRLADWDRRSFREVRARRAPRHGGALQSSDTHGARGTPEARG